MLVVLYAQIQHVTSTIARRFIGKLDPKVSLETISSEFLCGMVSEHRLELPPGLKTSKRPC